MQLGLAPTYLLKAVLLLARYKALLHQGVDLLSSWGPSAGAGDARIRAAAQP